MLMKSVMEISSECVKYFLLRRRMTLRHISLRRSWTRTPAFMEYRTHIPHIFPQITYYTHSPSHPTHSQLGRVETSNVFENISKYLKNRLLSARSERESGGWAAWRGAGGSNKKWLSLCQDELFSNKNLIKRLFLLHLIFIKQL